MIPEEVAESKKLPYFVHIAGQGHISDGFQLVSSQNDTFFSEPESQITYVFVAENAFIQLHFDTILHLLFKKLYLLVICVQMH